MDDKTKYFLGTITLDTHVKLEIKENDYLELITAKSILANALNIEEKYDVALCNYLEFEKEQLTLTLENLVNSVHHDYYRTYEVLSTLNRRLVNFLSTGRKYTELIAGLASQHSTNRSEANASITDLLRKHYDECLDYRTMEALRNHANHSGLAVHTVTTPSKWSVDENNDADSLVFNLEIYAEKKTLAENKGFKKSVLKELPEKFDLKKGARSYIGAISNIHEEARKLTSRTINSARATIETALKNYGELNNGDSFAIGAYRVRPNEPMDPPVMIILNWDDVRIRLLKKNISISNMTRRYITTAIVQK